MKAQAFPDQPGVYLFRAKSGEVIYVGKAVSLRNRVRSYFTSPAALNTRTMRMLNAAADLDFIVTDNEVEALILESNLIKRHRPRYNIRLRDDKHYPYVRITTGEPFPRVDVVRKAEHDEHRYFGPFTTSGALRQTLELLRKIFPYRTCSNHRLNRRRGRPCLHHQVGRCLGPCAGLVTEDEYDQMIEGLIRFFSGDVDDLLSDIRTRMQQSAENLDFELAARYRDQVRALEHIRERQKMIYASEEEEQDIVGMARRGEQVCVAMLFMREGRMVGQDHFYLSAEEDDPDDEILGAVLREYYADAYHVPRRVEVPHLPPDSDTMARWLSEKRGTKVFLHRPQRGRRRRLVEMASRNAGLQLKDDEIPDESGRQLAEALDLVAEPHRVECYDISNISGASSVGSMVVFEGGIPARHAYRRFRIRESEGPDDFAMMKEVLRRRFARLVSRKGEDDGYADPSFTARPDLVIVDGGAGQLSAALEVMDEAGVVDIPTIGLAKKEELVYRPGHREPLGLPRDSDALKFLQRVRDEAHRFAVSYHRQLRRKSSMRSILDDIPGIGAKRRNALLQQFDSLAAVAEASVDELAEVNGMNRRVARRVHRFLNEQIDLLI